MKVDGYVRFAVDTAGENGRIISYETNDIVLGDYFKEFVDEDINSLINMKDIKKINPTIEDCLVLATFSFKSFSSFNGEHTEYDNTISVKDVIILSNDYKLQWRKNLTTLYQHSFNKKEDEEGLQDIYEWEDFYNEDFTLFEEQKINKFSLLEFDLD